jgi:hypothetical protein
MAGEEIYTEEGCGINRRNFLKSAGIVVTGGTLAAGLTPAPESAKAGEEDCKQALAGNICCHRTYPRHPTAIMEAAPQITKGA